MTPQPTKASPQTSPKSIETQRVNDSSEKSSQTQKKYEFVYRGAKYDCSQFANSHPGGIEFLDKFIDEREDLNEYFDSLHSKSAIKTLKSQPVVNDGKTYKLSKDCEIYDELKQKIDHLIPPVYWKDLAIITFNIILLLVGVFNTNPLIAIPCIALAQILIGWVGHSWLHSRDKILNQAANLLVTAMGGLSPKWWNRKHNLHHMFTNNMNKDEDIQHAYNKLLFMFLFLKWKFDSIMTEYNSLRILKICVHWYLMSYQKFWIVLIGNLLAGHVTAVVLVGNHERERIFEGKINMNFIRHQIEATRNYHQTNFFWLMLFGGMQYQTEHHFFPQIPFYNLPKASKIIQQALAKHDLSIKVDSIM